MSGQVVWSDDNSDLYSEMPGSNLVLSTVMAWVFSCLFSFCPGRCLDSPWKQGYLLHILYNSVFSSAPPFDAGPINLALLRASFNNP
jgi:hypothetical protein